MAVFLSPVGGVAAQFFDNNGNPLTGGKLYSYAAGTTTPAATYTTSSGNTAHSNPIILDSAGRVPGGGEIWLTSGVSYKFVLNTAVNVLLGTWDNIFNIDNAAQITYTPATSSLLAPGPLTVKSALDQITNESSGSSVVGYLLNAPGSEPTTVEEKQRRYVDVLDFIPVAEHDAIRDGTSTYDCTADFITAFNYIQSNGVANEFSGEWPTNKKWTLTGPAGVYNFSDSFVTPVNARPDYVNFDIVFNGAQFKALPSYNTSNSLIHMKAAYDYVIQGIGFYGFKGTWVIFNDSSLTQNFGGKTVYRDLRFAECDYGIRHELESVVAVIDQCMTDKSMIQFLFVWRCDQMVIRDCFLNWSQTDRVTGEGYIEFGADQYVPTGEPAFPGGGIYNVGRLLIENCMCIPQDTPLVEARTAWVKMISGSLVIRSCHFGPEAANNRPFTVWSRIQGARYTGIADLVDAGITIEDSSCVNSWGMIYCDEYYPNYIRVRNIRFNVLDYSPNGTQRFLLAGDPGVLNPKSTNGYYTAAMSKFFMFDFGESVPQDNAIIPFNPDLLFPKFVSVYPEIALQDSYDTLNTPNQYTFFDLFDRDTLKPNFYEGAALYEFTLTGKLVNSVGPVEYNVSYKGLVEISTDGATMYIDYGSLYSTSRSTPAPIVIEAFLYDIPGSAAYASRPIATVVAGNYCIRVRAYTANINTTWQGTHAKIRRVT